MNRIFAFSTKISQDKIIFDKMKVRKTHEHLKTLPGFLRDLVLEQSSGPGEFNFVTIVEWDNPASVENAKAAVMAMHKAINFNPQELFARLGIKVDLANYRQVEA